MRPHRVARPAWSPRLGAALVALLLAIAFAILAHEATERELFEGDQAVHDIVTAWRSAALDGPMRAVSALGSGAVLIPLNLALGVALWRRRYRHPLLVPILTLAAAATEAVLKWLVHRPRPKAVGYGFPSGHVMGSIVFFGLVLYLLWRGRHGDGIACLATAVGVVVVAAVGVSRIYLNAHWLSDVLGGGAAGLAFLIFAVLRLEPRLTARTSATDPASLQSRPAQVSARRIVAIGVVVLALVSIGTLTFAASAEHWRHIAFEVLCLAIALGAIVARSCAVRRRATMGAVYLAEVLVILALASFPAHWLVFAGGVAAAAACGYLRWQRPAVAVSPQLLAGALLVLALPLDVLDDVLAGHEITADPVWMLSALVGVALITWSRLRGATTTTSA